jgi:hypothetical protein
MAEAVKLSLLATTLWNKSASLGILNLEEGQIQYQNLISDLEKECHIKLYFVYTTQGSLFNLVEGKIRCS